MQLAELITDILVILFTSSITALVVRNYYIKTISEGEEAYRELYEYAQHIESQINCPSNVPN